MRALTVDLSTATEINNIAMKGPETQGTWKSIESSARNHEMKYDINSRTTKDWNDISISKLFKHIKERLSDITLKNASYIIG